ncbi:MAG: exosortase system-associated protein, TIGR04073 family [Myxococcota bacterium]
MASPNPIFEFQAAHPARTDLHRSSGRAAFILALVFVLSAALPAMASAGGTPAKKLGRGAVNVVLGPLALPGQVVQTTREQGVFLGLTWGVVKGVGWTVATEAVGLWEVLTCPFETPPEFVAILDPVYPWEHFMHVDQKSERRVASERPLRQPRTQERRPRR